MAERNAVAPSNPDPPPTRFAHGTNCSHSTETPPRKDRPSSHRFPPSACDDDGPRTAEPPPPSSSPDRQNRVEARFAVPLGEWIRNAHERRGTQPDQWKVWILNAVRLASEVAGVVGRTSLGESALRRFGVDDFVVSDDRTDADEPGRPSFSVSIVGASLSVKINEKLTLPLRNGNTDCDSDRNEAGLAESELDTCNSVSLFCLGSVLYELFAGTPPLPSSSFELSSMGGEDERKCGGEDAPRKKKREKCPPPNACTPLREKGLPTNLCDIVIALLNISATVDGTNDYAYRSACEVEEDLRLMVSDPDRFLVDMAMGAETFCGRLDFPSDVLFGRAEQLSMLMGVFDRVIRGSRDAGAPEVVLISGYPGTGKSSLVQHTRQSLADADGFFLSGKFDEMQKARPFSAIVAAFDDYCDVIIERGADSLGDLRISFEGALGLDGCEVLMGLFPKLSKIIGRHDHSGSSSSIEVSASKEAHQRLKFLLRKFVSAISSDTLLPVILFLDDLQWADEASLELLHSLSIDRGEAGSFLFVGCYRDNEVGPGHLLLRHLREIHEAGSKITEIKLGNLERESVNVLTAHTLHLLPRMTRLLSDVVFSKTDGNALFVTQFLQSLIDEGLLHYSLSLRSWLWDVDMIQSKCIADNVAELMTGKMLRLSPEVQWALKVAACFGSQCEEFTLGLLSGDGEDAFEGIMSHLDVAVSEGLMVKRGPHYNFPHDQITSAAYSLIPTDEREALHLWIGRQIWSEVSDADREKVVFVAADQLNRGANLINSHELKVELARVNLRAGEKSTACFAFPHAAAYLSNGVRLLEESDWEDHYELCLKLFTSCAEVNYVIGNYTSLQTMLRSIFDHGTCFQDKIRAYHTLVNTLGAQKRVVDAVNIGREVLALLGETFPGEIDSGVVRVDLAITRNMLEGTTIDAILERDMMQDRSKISAMKFLSLLFMYTWMGEHALFPLVVFRMVRLTLSHGVCKESCLCFAGYGMMLIILNNDVKGGYSFGRVALSLLERLEANDFLAQVYCAIYCFVFSYVEPIQAALLSHAQAYEVGMLTGEVEWAAANVAAYAYAAMQSGRKLDMLAEELEKYALQMRDNEQRALLCLTLPCVQFVHNLMGRSCSDDPTVLTGDAMDQEALLKGVLGAKRCASIFCFVRMWLAYLFGDYRLAAKMSEGRRNSTPLRHSVNDVFYTGLTALALAHTTTGQRKWRAIASDSIKKMKSWAEFSSWNFQHRVELLVAEEFYLDGDVQEAAKAFDNSICSAGEHQFIHEQALACERAALFSVDIGNKITAAEYFTQARNLYAQWGAQRKVEHILKQINEL